MREAYVRLGAAAWVAAEQALAGDERFRATVLAALRERRGELREELADVSAAIALLTTRE
jgi:hypothetical protein